ncbi:hypothetical protein BJV78DRAFT_1239735 [Lactifluus subvellereus]|nr:hypothetical protein BJV78DRAFT_1239735 [Lactifluus subvellereus]
MTLCNSLAEYVEIIFFYVLSRFNVTLIGLVFRPSHRRSFSCSRIRHQYWIGDSKFTMIKHGRVNRRRLQALSFGFLCRNAGLLSECNALLWKLIISFVVCTSLIRHMRGTVLLPKLVANGHSLHMILPEVKLGSWRAFHTPTYITLVIATFASARPFRECFREIATVRTKLSEDRDTLKKRLYKTEPSLVR